MVMVDTKSHGTSLAVGKPRGVDEEVGERDDADAETSTAGRGAVAAPR